MNIFPVTVTPLRIRKTDILGGTIEPWIKLRLKPKLRPSDYKTVSLTQKASLLFEKPLLPRHSTTARLDWCRPKGRNNKMQKRIALPDSRSEGQFPSTYPTSTEMGFLKLHFLGQPHICQGTIKCFWGRRGSLYVHRDWGVACLPQPSLSFPSTPVTALSPGAWPSLGYRTGKPS